ncbi:ATPase, F1/V1/A1 complex, alpha/beta subunit [Tanacetum coccineum]|uniref:ATPase, F1/V1/A1 complex, alpha/beta subunit n=1 Tax=Tanacetum coccineum TaxID=301880 RepID=A0ABQ4Z0Z9_9ASTR
MALFTWPSKKEIADGNNNGTQDTAPNEGMVTDSSKVVEGVDELVSIIPKFFASLVTNEAVTSKASILDIHSKFVFGLYGYFVGKRVAFPVVENYIKNACKKFGLVRVVMNSKGFFFFKFASIEGMNEVLENGGLSVMATKLDGKEALHTVGVEYEWEPPRCGVCVCMVFGHDDMLCPKRHVEKPKKPIWQVASKKNSAGLSGKKVIQDVVGSVSGSPSNTPLVDDLVNEDNDNEVEEVYDETATYMASTSFNVNKASKSGSGERNKSLYEQWKKSHNEDPYEDDDFDDPGLTDAQVKFANAFDINLRGQLR